MNWQDYQKEASFKNMSVGKLNHTFVMEWKIQSGMISDFYEIEQDEFDNFHNWCEDEHMIMQIRLRNAICRGYWGHDSFQIFNEKYKS